MDTAAKRAQYRAVMIPAGAVADARSSEHGAAYTYESCGKFLAIAFWGSAGKPYFHYSYWKAEQRAAKLDEFFKSIAAHIEFKARTKPQSSGGHDVKLGDIFRCSWGYDQTNIDYYQCTALIGACMMEVREIDSQSEDTAWLQGKCVPSPGAWTTEPDGSDAGQAYKAEHGYYPRVPCAPRRVKISVSNGEPCFRVASYASAYRIKPVAVIADKPIFAESHWTAYA
jgi:hypothetical protein